VQRQTRLTHEQRVELIGQYEAGVPILELARRFWIHRTSVSVILKEAGVLKPRQALTLEQVELAIQLRAQGRFYRQIAERFGVDTETVRRAVIKWRSQT
jgi:DNA invertase Pin-like site-specific DNA recombinase